MPKRSAKQRQASRAYARAHASERARAPAHARETGLDQSNLPQSDGDMNRGEYPKLSTYIQTGDRVQLNFSRDQVFKGARGTVQYMYRQHGMVMAYIKLDRTNRYGNGHICCRRPISELFPLEAGQKRRPTPLHPDIEHDTPYQSPMSDDVREPPIYPLVTQWTHNRATEYRPAPIKLNPNVRHHK